MARLYNAPYASVEPYFRVADVHEKERVQEADSLVALLLSLLWSFLHAINMYWLFWSELPFVYSLLIHVVLTVVIAVVTTLLKGLGRDIRHLYVLTIASFGGGIFGAVGSLLATLLTLLYKRFSLPFAEWYRAIYPDFSFSREEQLYEMITSGKDESVRSYSVVSFRDVIALGTEQQKRRALTRMTDHFHPSFAPAYRLALQNSSNTIRVQAASSITRIENQFVGTLIALERLEKKHPKDAVLKLGLARYYDSYAFTGLLDTDREEENRVKALQKYKEYLEMEPDDITARIEAGRLLLRSKAYDEVVQLFRDCMEAGYMFDSLRLWMIEALYEAKRYDELRQMAPSCVHLLGELKDRRPRLSAAIAFWAGVPL
jgi:polysaccharide biosynthesis protein PelE